MSKIYNSITELIGDTPIVRLNNIVPKNATDVYVKIETFNPGSSIKGRIAPRMTEDAERAGTVRPGDIIAEPTSGNTGIGLVWIGAAKGYRMITTMPEITGVERCKIIRAYDTGLVLAPGSEGMKGAIARAKEATEEKNGWVPLQFANPPDPVVHEDATSAEVIEAFGPAGLNAFVSGVGTDGTISGVSRALKKANPNVQAYAVEADEPAVLSGEKPGPHKIQGISAGFIPDTLDTKAYDDAIRVASDDTVITSRNLGGKEGSLVGISSGAAICAAIEKAKELGKDKRVLALLPDNGERYLSISLYNFSD